jgi:hypothetical protein
MIGMWVAFVIGVSGVLLLKMFVLAILTSPALSRPAGFDGVQRVEGSGSFNVVDSFDY